VRLIASRSMRECNPPSQLIAGRRVRQHTAYSVEKLSERFGGKILGL
jgi:hypothetical protein